MSDARHNIEAEQQLLGALLVNNENFDRIDSIIDASDFYDPVHADIFTRIAEIVGDGGLASPITMKSDFQDHAGLKELGGPGYLARLAGASISSNAAKSYAELIKEDSACRGLQKLASDMQDVLTKSEGLAKARDMMETVLTETPDLRRGPTSVSFLGAATETLRNMGEAFRGREGFIRTGLVDLDHKIGGLFPTDLIVLGGRPSMGKTALALDISRRVGDQGKIVAFVSLEMTAPALADRLISTKSGLNYSDARRGDFNEAQYRKVAQVVKEMQALPVFTVPSNIKELSAILSAIRKIKAQQGRIDLIVFDYMQLVRVASARNRFDEISEISRSLKEAAKFFECPVLALSQLSRGVESRDDKRPMLSDLRESGQIEQDADVVLFCYRDHYYLERRQRPEAVGELADYEDALKLTQNQVDVIIAKQRMGSIGAVKLGCHLPTNRFWDLEKQYAADFQ